MRFAGVDAGTKSYRILWFDKTPENFEVVEIPTEKVRKNPETILEALERINADVYAGLSGYGIPVKHFSELSDSDVKLMTLTLEKEASLGLRSLIRVIARSELEFYTIPAVIHLNTIPHYRKLFKVDMGTYDKLCTAFAVSQEFDCRKMVVVEAGYGYTSFIAMDDGRIVDGLGGTSFFPSYSSAGCIDAEVAYLLGDFPKNLLKIGLRDVLSQEEAVKVLAENALKGIRAMEVSINGAEKVILSGRFAAEMAEKLKKRDCRIIVYDKYRNASALGAAMIASAVKGAKMRGPAEKMGITSACGTVLDYLPEKWRALIERRLGLRGC